MMARPGRRSPPPEGFSGRRLACSRGWRALRRAAGAGAGAGGSGARVSGRQRPPCAKGAAADCGQGMAQQHGAPTARSANRAGRPWDQSKQMGPALLPTPLSPARGQPLLAWLPANLQPLRARSHAWRPMSRPPPPRAVRHPVGGFVTGARAGIRLSLPSCRPALARGAPARAAPQGGWAEAASLYRLSPRQPGSRRCARFLSGQVLGLSGGTTALRSLE